MGPLLIRGGYSASFRFSKVTFIFLRNRENKYFLRVCFLWIICSNAPCQIISLTDMHGFLSLVLSEFFYKE